MKFPQQALSPTTILTQLESYKQADLPWKTGRVFAYVYEAPPVIKACIEEAYLSFLTENGLDPTAFPSLLRLEREVIAMVADLLHAPEALGSFTSGGTESIMLALKAVRDYSREHRPELLRPHLVLPITAHAAFQKAAHYLGFDFSLVGVEGPSYAVAVEAMEAAIRPETVLLVASAPCYPFGVLDPIAELSDLAIKHGVFFHVDACVGGMYLPFIEGDAVPVFDFRLAGVSSMSCDLHKYGYAAKGASCVLYREEALRLFQYFSCSNWSGYSIVNPTVLSSKSGGPLAGAWAALRAMAAEGYRAVVAQTQAAMRAIRTYVEAEIPELVVLGQPAMNLLALGLRSGLDFSVFDLAERMKAKAWYLQVQLASASAAESLHFNINPANLPHISAMLEDLKAVVAACRLEPSPPMDLASMAEALGALDSEDLGFMLGQLGLDFERQDGNNMLMVNHLLNGMGVEQRDSLLKSFMSFLFKG